MTLKQHFLGFNVVNKTSWRGTHVLVTKYHFLTSPRGASTQTHQISHFSYQITREVFPRRHTRINQNANSQNTSPRGTHIKSKVSEYGAVFLEKDSRLNFQNYRSLQLQEVHTEKKVSNYIWKDNTLTAGILQRLRH